MPEIVVVGLLLVGGAAAVIGLTLWGRRGASPSALTVTAHALECGSSTTIPLRVTADRDRRPIFPLGHNPASVRALRSASGISAQT